MTRFDRWLRQAVPIAIALVVVAVALLLGSNDHWRRGAATLAIAAAVAALLRIVVPERYAGPLAVRSRAFDVTFLVLLTALLATMALAIDAES